MITCDTTVAMCPFLVFVKICEISDTNGLYALDANIVSENVEVFGIL